MLNMALLLLQPMALLQRMPLPKRMPLLEDMPVELTVALPVPLNRLVVISSTPLALARRPMTFLVKRMPRNQVARESGTPVRVRRGEAACV